jgi:O-methyltransferase domain
LHDWSTEDCIKILKNIAGAMDPSKSRLLISEAVLPLQGADPEAGWLDLTMMSAGGMERTEKQWIELLDASGFKLGKLWQVPGSIYAVVEAYLK